MCSKKSVFKTVCFGFILCVSVLLGAGKSSALLEKMNLEDLTKKASSIIMGKVVTMNSQWGKDGNIYTYVKVSVEQDIKGVEKGKKEVTIKVIGGTVKGITEFVSDTPIFQIGERAVLFLENDQIVGWQNGKFTISNHAVQMGNSSIEDAEFINRIRDILNLSPLKIEREIESVLATPVVTTITPTTTAAGTRGNPPFGPGGGISDITITGSNFGTKKGTVIIPRGYGSPQESDYIYSWTNTQIKCHIPCDGYSGGIKVKTAANITSAAYNYVITFGTYWTKGLNSEVKWKKPAMGEKYLVNENCPGVTDELNAIKSAMNTWSTTEATFTFSYGGPTTVNTTIYDGKNVIAWNDLATGVLAANYLWWSTPSGNITESDIIFNTKYQWSSTGEAGKYDIQNIVTHELGHALFLADLYGTADTEKTMYGYGAAGETKKQTLETDDKNGIKYLYGTK